MMVAPTVYGFDAMEFMKEAGEDTQDESTESTEPTEPIPFTESDDSVEGSTILPSKDDLTVSDCEVVMRYVNSTPVKEIKEIIAKKESVHGLDLAPVEGKIKGDAVKYTQILGCAVTTGDIKMWMIPFFIRYVLEFIIGIAGLLAVGGVVYGGYLYLFAGLSDDKDKGKNAIKNGIIGLVLVLTAWAVVNIVISLVTM